MGVAAGEIRDCAVDVGYSSGGGMRAVVVERNGRPCRLCVVCARVKASAKEKERAREGVEGRGAREGGEGARQGTVCLPLAPFVLTSIRT